MLEHIYYMEINLDDEKNFTVEITKDNVATKWDGFAKTEAFSGKNN